MNSQVHNKDFYQDFWGLGVKISYQDLTDGHIQNNQNYRSFEKYSLFNEPKSLDCLVNFSL